MTRTASELIEAYLARLRVELAGLGAADAGDLLAEVRSLLIDAAGDDPDSAEAEIARFGDPEALAASILAERGAAAETGMSGGAWWRMGIAVPLDILIGIAVPAVVAFPAYMIAAYGQPRLWGVALGIAGGAAALLWPWYVWRPWRRGGRAVSPGMALTGLAVVRTPGSWRVVRWSELGTMGISRRRNRIAAVAITVLAAALLAGSLSLGLDRGRSWLSAAIVADEHASVDGPGWSLTQQLQSVADGVYNGLQNVPSESAMAIPMQYLTPDSSPQLPALRDRVRGKRIIATRIGTPVPISPGVYRVEVREYLDESAKDQVGSSTFTMGRRVVAEVQDMSWDWAVVEIVVGRAPAK